MESLKQVLMRRDGLSEVEAKEQIAEARQELRKRLDQGETPYDLCEEMFGLEPDYLEELLF